MELKMKIRCKHKISTQKEIGLRVGLTPSVVSQMRKYRPIHYRAILIGVLVESCLGIEGANELIKEGCGNPKVLPTSWELIYE